MTYDPDQQPDAAWWLELDESERIEQVHSALSARGEEPPPVRATVQAVVETQIAAYEPPAVRRAAERLTDEGLRRNIVLRTLTVKLIQHMHRAMQQGSFDHAAYERDLDSLTGAAILAGALGLKD